MLQQDFVSNEIVVTKPAPVAATTADLLPAKIALGWIASLLVQTIVMVMMIVETLLREASTGFRSLHIDPGTQGLRMLVYAVAFYALMPVYVFAVRSLRPPAFRWIAVAASFAGFMFLLLHHLSHVFFHQRPDFTSNVMDLTLHVIGLWVIVNSIRWARVAR